MLLPDGCRLEPGGKADGQAKPACWWRLTFRAAELLLSPIITTICWQRRGVKFGSRFPGTN